MERQSKERRSTFRTLNTRRVGSERPIDQDIDLAILLSPQRKPWAGAHEHSGRWCFIHGKITWCVCLSFIRCAGLVFCYHLLKLWGDKKETKQSFLNYIRAINIMVLIMHPCKGLFLNDLRGIGSNKNEFSILNNHFVKIAWLIFLIFFGSIAI